MSGFLQNFSKLPKDDQYALAETFEAAYLADPDIEGLSNLRADVGKFIRDETHDETDSSGAVE